MPEIARIHPVFHVSLLRAYKGQPQDQLSQLPLITIGTQPHLLPVEILGNRIISTKKGLQRQVLVQWETFSPDEATWEPLEAMKQSFPDLDLEDKVKLNKGGNDTILVPNIEAKPTQIAERSTRPKRQVQNPIWMRDYSS